jgi:hypothetical protein
VEPPKFIKPEPINPFKAKTMSMEEFFGSIVDRTTPLYKLQEKQPKPGDKKIMDAPRFIVNPMQRATLQQLKFIQKFNDRQIFNDDTFIRRK